VCGTQATDAEPYVIWLSGLHVPESYLTALVQATCRKNGWPLDKSTLYTSVTNYADPEDVTERIHQGMTQQQSLEIRGFAIMRYIYLLTTIDIDIDSCIDTPLVHYFSSHQSERFQKAVGTAVNCGK